MQSHIVFCMFHRECIEMRSSIFGRRATNYFDYYNVSKMSEHSVVIFFPRILIFRVETQHRFIAYAQKVKVERSGKTQTPKKCRGVESVGTGCRFLHESPQRHTLQSHLLQSHPNETKAASSAASSAAFQPFHPANPAGPSPMPGTRSPVISSCNPVRCAIRLHLADVGPISGRSLF